MSVEQVSKQNTELRNLLREVLALDPERPDATVLRDLHVRIRDRLQGLDGRKTRAGFTNPEVLASAQAARRAASQGYWDKHGPTLRKLRDKNMSLAAIAAHLNDLGIPAPAGGMWARGSVKHALDRLARE